MNMIILLLIIIIIIVIMASEFSDLAITHVSSGVRPTSLIHMIWILVLLNLAWWIILFLIYGLFWWLLIFISYECRGVLVFCQSTSSGSFKSGLLNLLWLSCSKFFDTPSVDMHSYSPSLWTSSRCCNHLALPHPLTDTYLCLFLDYQTLFVTGNFLSVIIWKSHCPITFHFLLLSGFC